ncbi:Phosphoglycolate phosphatase [compost metagenome]
MSAGLAELRIKTKGTHWLVISGGDQQELREIFSQRGLLNYFDMGIYGSPSSKDEIIARESLAGKIIAPVLFFGDSQYDYEAAKRAGMDFAFVSDWSESKFDFSGADVEIRQLSDALKLLI